MKCTPLPLPHRPKKKTTFKKPRLIRVKKRKKVYEIKHKMLKKWVLLNCAPSSIHLHHTHFNFHHAPIHLHPGHFSLHLAIYITLNVIRAKISHVFWQLICQNLKPKNLELSILTENWYTCSLGIADLESRLIFIKFPPQNPFLSKFGPKKSKLSNLPKTRYTWYLEDADFYYDISFLNFET